MNAIISKSNNKKIRGLAETLPATEWDKTSSNIFDLIESKKPEYLFIASTDIADNAVAYAMQEFQPQNIKFILLQEDDLVYTQNFDLVVNLNDIPYAIKQHNKGQYKTEFESYVSVFTSNLTEQQIECVNRLGQNFQIKIYGPQKIDNVFYLGQISDNDYLDILASCKINVMFNKEWFYYCISNECLPLYFSIKEQNDFTFNNYNDLLVKCRNIVGSVSTSQIDIPTYQDIANNIKDKLLCK